jgi:hypothetical protein
MRKKAIYLIIAILTFVIGIAASTIWYFSYRLPVQPPAQLSVPQGWKKVKLLSQISFAIPPDMLERNVQGTDLAIWEHRNNNMLLTVYYGHTAPDFNSLPNPIYEYREEMLELNGKKAKVLTFRLDDSLVNTFGNGDSKYLSAVYIPGDGDNLSMWVNCKSQAEQDVAKKIFQTISFQ